MNGYYVAIVGIQVLVALYLYHSIYLLGIEHGDKEKYYKNCKGTLFGKYKFTERFMELLFSTFALNWLLLAFFKIHVDNIFIPWFQAMVIAFALISVFELFVAKKTLWLFAIFSSIVVISLIYFPTKFGILLMSKIVFIAIIMDFTANFFGKLLSKLPENRQFLRLKYPKYISKNKSFTAVLISVFIMLCVSSLYLTEMNLLLVFFVSIGAAFGDAIFSVYKRIGGIDDFIPTLGSIGGMNDRIDGWIGALFFAFIYLIL